MNDKKNKDSIPREHVLEILAAILLSLATLASAWSAYQSTRWSGVQTIFFSEASSLRNESVRNTNIGSRKVTVDVGMFVQYAAAISSENKILSDFLFERFRPELKSATARWLKMKPLQNPKAPSSPFVMKDYRITELEKAEENIKIAEFKFSEAKKANQTGDNYVLLTVLFASVLFFAGVGTKFQLFKIKVLMLSFGTLIFTIAAMIVISFPVH